MLKSKSKKQNLFELETNHATFKSETKTCHEQLKMQILSPLNEIANRMFLLSLITGVVSKASFFLSQRSHSFQSITVYGWPYDSKY